MKLILFTLTLFSAGRPQAQLNPATVYYTPDSVQAIASNRYEAHSFLRTFFMGNTYRDAWEQPVTVPVFYLSRSGFTIKELGGGMQTKSLHLVDAQGRHWALRTVDKYVQEALPSSLQNTLAEKLSQDLISASFPYGALITGELAYAAGITCARPRMFLVADDEALGPFRSIFANALCSLEERDPGFDSTVSTKEMLVDLRKNNNYLVAQKVLLKARLLDMLLADWDRHEDNWRWGTKDSAGRMYYYAVPRDRDWAFYKSNGAVPQLARVIGAMRFLNGFKEQSTGLTNLNYKAWQFDKTLLNELTGADWQTVCNEFVQALPDAAIEAAVKILPKEMYALYRTHFEQTLKTRRDGLLKNAMKYYDFLSEEVVITGSDEPEHFVVSGVNGDLTVKVIQQKGGKDGLRTYKRLFISGETFFVTLNGLGGNDTFEVDTTAISKIKLSINAGEGTDKYDLQGNFRLRVNDVATGESVINKMNAKLRFN